MGLAIKQINREMPLLKKIRKEIMASPSYFLKIGRTIAGPFSIEKINSLWNDRKLAPLTMVSSDKETWENIQSFLGIYEQEDDGEEPGRPAERQDEPEESGEYEESKPKEIPRRKRQVARSLRTTGAEKSTSTPSALLVVAGVAWSLLALAMAGGVILFFAALSKSQSAIQEAAISSLFGTVFIGLYVFVRSIDKIILILDRINAR